VLEKQKDDFISLASRELKRPVTALKTSSELPEENLTECGAVFNLSILKKLNGQVDWLINLIPALMVSCNLLNMFGG
jgi:hypothetical protein